MTTIALKKSGNTIIVATDSQITYGNNSIMNNPIKGFPLDSGGWLFLSGLSKNIYAIKNNLKMETFDNDVDWLNSLHLNIVKIHKDNDLDLAEVQIIGITPNLESFFYHNTVISVGQKMIAVGSGDNFALGAMYAGADPFKAVKIAKKLDINTGGKVHYIIIMTKGNK